MGKKQGEDRKKTYFCAVTSINIPYIMNKIHLALAFLALAGAVQAQTEVQADTSLLQYVDPLIGSGGHGHVGVGASVPGGMVLAGPTLSGTGWDYTSGYHYSCDSIVGFAQTHLSGTGCADLGDVALMPSLMPLELSREGLASTFSHASEVARPGYYAVTLDRGQIRVEATATDRVALYRFTYPRGSTDAQVAIDLRNGVGDRLTRSRIFQVDEYTLCGFRHSHGWAADQQLWFCIRFDRPIHQFLSQGPTSPYAQATFEVEAGDQVMAKVALSPTGEMGAMLNMRAEQPEWDFAAVRDQAARRWGAELSRIRAELPAPEQMRIFYTALYHALFAPQLWCDVTGDYRGADGQTRYGAAWNNLTTWSLWDTYRALHPLYTIILRERMPDFINTLISISQEQGELPVWHLMGNETWCMVGSPAVPVLSDLLVKGLVPRGQRQIAFAVIAKSLMKETRGLPWMWSHGYVPSDVGQDESVSKSLEYSLAFGAAQRAASALGLKEDSAALQTGAQGYRRLFDADKRFMVPRLKDGSPKPMPDFNPCHQSPDYTEGTPWQYAWLAPHDVPGLVSLYPTPQAFIGHLDSLFQTPAALNADANPDISGLIGQYAHGNEPGHHIPYLYTYVGQPWKTAQIVHQIMTTLYTDRPDGLCGNEDAGQLSAWYILSALGLYQVEPASDRFRIGSPAVTRATLSVGGGRTFTIQTHNLSPRNIYVQGVKLNGQPWPHPYILYRDIAQGGTLEFTMGGKPKQSR